MKFIEYELLTINERYERGIINMNHVMSIEVEQHGGGYGKAINLWYANRYEYSCIFISDDDDLVEKILDGFKGAMMGSNSYFMLDKLQGFIKPIEIKE